MKMKEVMLVHRKTLLILCSSLLIGSGYTCLTVEAETISPVQSKTPKTNEEGPDFKKITGFQKELTKINDQIERVNQAIKDNNEMLTKAG